MKQTIITRGTIEISLFTNAINEVRVQVLIDGTERASGKLQKANALYAKKIGAPYYIAQMPVKEATAQEILAAMPGFESAMAASPEVAARQAEIDAEQAAYEARSVRELAQEQYMANAGFSTGYAITDKLRGFDGRNF